MLLSELPNSYFSGGFLPRCISSGVVISRFSCSLVHSKILGMGTRQHTRKVNHKKKEGPIDHGTRRSSRSQIESTESLGRNSPDIGGQIAPGMDTCAIFDMI